MRNNDASLTLSIVIATTKPWPEIRDCLNSLQDQARALQAEVIVADGHGSGLPDDPGLYPGVIHLKVPGASVFYLRGFAMSQVRGDIIAVTEDHCQVNPDWCQRIIESHQEYPDAAAIGGAVENGATERLIDWANYFLVFAPFMLPIRNGDARRISLQANVSYKKRVIPRANTGLGMMEMLFNRRLYAQGEKLIADDRLVVYHVQSHGFWRTFAAHFHNGRSIAGFRLQSIHPLERLARLASSFILPPFLLWYTLRPVFSKRRNMRQVIACLPLLFGIVCSHAAGEFIGYIRGPGNSPRRLA